MSRHFVTAAWGGGVGGLLDIVYALLLWGVILGDNPTGVLQSIAAGLLGSSAFKGGLNTALLGLALHFFIAWVMALVYVLAATRLPVLTARPWLMGAAYGLLLYVVMNFVVLPLSAIGFRPPGFWGSVRALLPHVIFVGPAIALFAARATRRQKGLEAQALILS